MPDLNGTLDRSRTSDATMLMCALLVNTARKEGPSAFENFMNITDAQSLQNAIFKAYQDIQTGRR